MCYISTGGGLGINRQIVFQWFFFFNFSFNCPVRHFIESDVRMRVFFSEIKINNTNIAVIILNVFIIHSSASTVYDKPVCYLIYNTNKLYNLPSYSCVWPSTHVDVIYKRKLVLQLINCSHNFSSNSYLDNTQSIIITNTNL